jgi:GNAT superfamily N-acetyltransferase
MPDLTVRPLTADRWADLEVLFAARGCGAARRCWCMHYRRTGRTILPVGGSRSDSYRAALRKLASSDEPPGLIAYRGRTPVGWISLGPREHFARLHRSSVMKAVDDTPVWSIVCFVVPAEHRSQGVARRLLEAAIEYARKRGATMLEAYPVDRPERSSDEAMWFGAKSMYDDAGFREVTRRRPHRPVVRRRTAPGKRSALRRASSRRAGTKR